MFNAVLIWFAILQVNLVFAIDNLMPNNLNNSTYLSTATSYNGNSYLAPVIDSSSLNAPVTTSAVVTSILASTSPLQSSFRSTVPLLPVTSVPSAVVPSTTSVSFSSSIPSSTPQSTAYSSSSTSLSSFPQLLSSSSSSLSLLAFPQLISSSSSLSPSSSSSLTSSSSKSPSSLSTSSISLVADFVQDTQISSSSSSTTIAAILAATSDAQSSSSSSSSSSILSSTVTSSSSSFTSQSSSSSITTSSSFSQETTSFLSSSFQPTIITSVVSGQTVLSDSYTTVTLAVSSTPSTGRKSNQDKYEGLSKKNRNVVIGCVVGIGFPFLVVLSVVFYLFCVKSKRTEFINSDGRVVTSYNQHAIVRWWNILIGKKDEDKFDTNSPLGAGSPVFDDGDSPSNNPRNPFEKEYDASNDNIMTSSSSDNSSHVRSSFMSSTSPFQDNIFRQSTFSGRHRSVHSNTHELMLDEDLFYPEEVTRFNHSPNSTNQPNFP